MKRFFCRSLILCTLTLLNLSLKASDPGIAYPDPPGGWNYIYRGDQVAFGTGAFDALDGTWNRNNGSSEWDGSALDGTIQAGNFPGGAMTVTNAANPAENTVTYLRIQDPGNPAQYSGAANNGCGG